MTDKELKLNAILTEFEQAVRAYGGLINRERARNQILALDTGELKPLPDDVYWPENEFAGEHPDPELSEMVKDDPKIVNEIMGGLTTILHSANWQFSDLRKCIKGHLAKGHAAEIERLSTEIKKLKYGTKRHPDPDCTCASCYANRNRARAEKAEADLEAAHLDIQNLPRL